MDGHGGFQGRDGGTLLPEHERLSRFLLEREVAAEIIWPGRDTSSVQSAAAALDVRPGQIVKSLLFLGKDGDTVLVIARGTARIDQRKLVAVTGIRKPKLAPPEMIQRVTGFPPGGVPPVGHATPVKVVMDRTVLDEPVVYGGGGCSDSMLRISPADIQSLTGALVADLRLGDDQR
jgi:prolyl-tRNA editing enzyme YbaK/EbsC (Cys-tRNA(Pro) deacylase)